MTVCVCVCVCVKGGSDYYTTAWSLCRHTPEGLNWGSDEIPLEMFRMGQPGWQALTQIPLKPHLGNAVTLWGPLICVSGGLGGEVATMYSANSPHIWVAMYCPITKYPLSGVCHWGCCGGTMCFGARGHPDSPKRVMTKIGD